MKREISVKCTFIFRSPHSLTLFNTEWRESDLSR